MTRNQVNPCGFRGFESLPLRHIQNWAYGLRRTSCTGCKEQGLGLAVAQYSVPLAGTRIASAVFFNRAILSHMTATQSGKPRYMLIDALRGVAIAMMAVFHFCFDLAYFNLADFDFYRDPVWLHLRTFILSLFLALVGISLVLATRNGLDPNRFTRRLLLLILSAVAISGVTWWMFGQRFVFFGVLHFIAVASVLSLAFLRFNWVNLLLGVALIMATADTGFAWFDKPGWRWIGLMTHKPATEDYVPLLPWFGVVLVGLFIGRQLPHLPWIPRLDQRLRQQMAPRMLASAGRHSLLIYLVHQPLLIGLLYAYVRVAG